MLSSPIKKLHSPDELKGMARWIRDDIDPQVAREGPQVISADDVLLLHDTLTTFINDPPGAGISPSSLRYSRIHQAILEISTKATRWPGRLIDLCDDVIKVWERLFGPLKDVQLMLYGAGGRLYGVLKPGYFTREETIRQFREQQRVRRGTADILDMAALEYGHLGFTPGQWWIDPVLAFRDGIINDLGNDKDIVHDANGAYAVVLSGTNETNCSDPTAFTLRTKSSDRGRYRLTAGDANSRNPIRVLRAYNLNSPWAPKVGIRYDGLYKVNGWAILPENSLVYNIYFVREPNQRSMDEVLRRPWADEREDYVEYKRLRNVWRQETRNKREEKRKRNFELAHQYVQSLERSSEDSSDPIPHQSEGLPRLGKRWSQDKDKAAKVLGQPQFPQEGEMGPLTLQSSMSSQAAVTSSSLKSALKDTVKATGTKDGSTDEARRRPARVYDGSEDQYDSMAASASSNASDTESPINNAADIGRLFAVMNLGELQTVNAMYSKYIKPRKATGGR